MERAFGRMLADLDRELSQQVSRQKRGSDRYLKQLKRQVELESALAEEESHQEELRGLVRLHHSVHDAVDWESLRSCTSPEPPARKDSREQEALAALVAYTPSVLDRVASKDIAKRAQLEDRVLNGVEADHAGHRKRLVCHFDSHAQWRRRRDLAERVLSSSCPDHDEIFGEFDALAAASRYVDGVSVVSNATQEVLVRVDSKGASVVPSEKKRVLQNGRLSVKPVPRQAAHETYRDHAASLALFGLGQCFALLRVELAILTIWAPLPSDGHTGSVPVFSVAASRSQWSEMGGLVWIPWVIIGSFEHRMRFRKTKGLARVDPLTPDQLTWTRAT